MRKNGESDCAIENRLWLEDEPVPASVSVSVPDEDEEDNGAASEAEDAEEDEIELVVQGKDIVVSERLLVKHSRSVLYQ